MLDVDGRALWRKVLNPAPTRPSYEGDYQKFWTGDLDDDGRIEVLLAYQSIGSESALICFSDTGREKWRFAPGRQVHTDRQTYPVHFAPANFALARWGEGGSWTVVLSSTHLEFPTQVALLAKDGRMLGEYWHSGHLPHIAVSGRELWLGGVNNKHKRATIVVLDADRIAGASVEGDPYYQIRDFPPAAEKARFLFPRTCVNIKSQLYNCVTRLAVETDRADVQIAELPLPTGATVWYTLGRDFAVKRAFFLDSFLVKHSEMRAAGLLDHDFTSREEADLYKVQVLRSGQHAGNHEAREIGR